MQDSESLDYRDYLTICLVSFAIMIYQIALTRILSVVVWYHFAFLTISLVMLGLGAPGVWFALSKRPLRYLPGFLLAGGITVPLSIAGVIKYGALALESSIAYIVFLVLPATLSMGGVICLLLIKATGKSISRMYGIDLLGAAVAAMLVIPAMHVIPTPILAGLVGLLPLLCLLLYPGKIRIAALVAVFVSVVLMVQGDAYQIVKGKKYDEKENPPIFERWSPTARITVYDENFEFLQWYEEGFAWGRGKNFPQDKQIKQYWLLQDGSNGTPLTNFSGDLSEVEHLLFDVTSVGYQLRPPENAAIIGAGGGRDVLTALLVGATDIDAIEINEQTVRAVNEVFGDFTGRIYDVPGVNKYVNDGRSHLTYSEKIYDFVQISLIDSKAASAAGAFALAENNLFTLEAFELYTNRLSNNGIISTSRFMNQSPRMVVLGMAALDRMQIETPKKHIALITAKDVCTMLLSRSPFSAGEIESLAAISKDRGFKLIFPVQPGIEPVNPKIIEAVENRLEPYVKYGANIEPPTDDSPYFFHIISPFTRVNEIPAELSKLAGTPAYVKATMVLQQTMIWVSALALLMFAAPFVARASKQQNAESFNHLFRASVFFAAIGAGFMLIENMLVQRFVLYLGHPSFAVTVIIASLLVGMGIGASSAARIGISWLQRFGWLAPLLVLLMISLLPDFFEQTLGYPRSIKIAMSCVLLSPFGLVLGLFFPLGMLRFGDNSKAWYWAINGVFGVVASVMSLSLSMEFGYTMVGIAGAAIYVVAWLCLRGSRSAKEMRE
jgi:hypothetical protein